MTEAETHHVDLTIAEAISYAGQYGLTMVETSDCDVSTVTSWLPGNEWPRVGFADDNMFLTFDEVLGVRSRSGSDVVEFAVGPTVTDDIVVHLLLEAALPRVLALRGHLVLHASGVSGPAGAVLFLGPSGSGKSTLAVALGRRGYPALADDSSVLGLADGRYMVLPSNTGFRLRADSLDALSGSLVVGVPESTTGKWRVRSSKLSIPVCANPAPLRAIVSLEFGNVGPALEAVGPSKAFPMLVDQSFDVYRSTRDSRVAALDRWGPVCARVPVFRLLRHRSFSDLARVSTLIERHLLTGP